jgi:class 3 adenylate cyclase
MPLKEELQDAVAKIFRESWTERDGQMVPVHGGIKLGNDAVKLDATVLYADMAESTQLVNEESPQFAAEVYKSYLTYAARIIKSEGGTITAYDGDRIMAVFIGKTKNTTAARCALKINYSVQSIINPALVKQYSDRTYKVRHHVGIDSSSLFISRIGVRNDNDLVWVGRAANYAAKLCAIREFDTVFVTENVFNTMLDGSKFSTPARELMWKERKWSQMGNQRVYSSTWRWTI